MTRTREEAARWLTERLTYERSRIDPDSPTAEVEHVSEYDVETAFLDLTAPHVGATGSPTSETGKVEAAIQALIDNLRDCSKIAVNSAKAGPVLASNVAARVALSAAIEADKAALRAERDEARAVVERVKATSGSISRMGDTVIRVPVVVRLLDAALATGGAK